MTRVGARDDFREPGDDDGGGERQPSGPLRIRRGVPRWVALLGCCAAAFWSCLKVYDYQHAAARSARALLSLNASERIAAIHEVEGSGRVDTEVAIRGLQDADPEVRAAAAMALVSAVPGTRGSTGPSEKNVRATLKALINSLGDRDKSVRAAATRALWMVALVASLPEGSIDFEPATSADPIIG